MPLESEQFLPAGAIPHLCGLIATRRGQTLSVWAPGHAIHRTGVSLHDEQFLPAGCIPHLCGLIITCCGQTRAIRTSGHIVHIVERIAGVAFQGEQFLAAGYIPPLRGSVLTRRCQVLAVRASVDLSSIRAHADRYEAGQCANALRGCLRGG